MPAKGVFGPQKRPSLVDQFKQLYKDFGGGAALGGFLTRFGRFMNNPQWALWNTWRTPLGRDEKSLDIGKAPTGKAIPPAGFQDPYKNYQLSPLRTVDPEAVIAASKPRLEEEAQRGFANVAARFGAAGGGFANTPYASALGTVQRNAQNDLNQLTQQYLFDASKFNRANELAQQQLKAEMDRAEAERALESWGRSGGWDMESQLDQLNRQFQEWAKTGEWKLGTWRDIMSGRERDRSTGMGLFQSLQPQDPSSTILSLLGMQQSQDLAMLEAMQRDRDYGNSMLANLNNYAANNYSNLSPTAALNRARSDLEGYWNLFGMNPRLGDIYSSLFGTFGGNVGGFSRYGG